MRHSILPIFLIISSMSCSKAQIKDLKDFEWDNRLLIIYAEDENSKTLKSQLSKIETQNSDFEERDLEIIILKNQ
jgi:hypothetical protein